MRAFCTRMFRGTGKLVIVGLVLLTGGVATWVATVQSSQTKGPPASTPPTHETNEAGKVRRVGQHELIVPPAVVRRMGLSTAQAAAPSRPIKLPPFPGCLALDSNRLARVRSRFPGEVVSVGTRPGPDELASLARPLRFGDRVRQGDLLAVVWSKDLGEKKSELVDALCKLRADEVFLSRARELYEGGAGPERSVLEAERNAQASRVAVERAERTLRSWRLTEEEIAAVRAEADRVASAGGKLRPAEANQWARAEVRAPRDGVVLEKNVSVGDIVDTSSDLFKVGDVSELTIWAHVYEEDLPLLQALPRPLRWTVSLPSRPGTSFSGTLDQIGEVIDPNQHTALVSGRVKNPDGVLKVGQFVTVHVELPPPSGEVEVPADAVVEDGRESVVFIQPSLNESRYVCQPVRVLRRFRDVIYVRAEEGGLQAGQRVVTNGALLLRAALNDLPAPQ